MTDGVAIALVAAIAPTLAGLAAVFASLINGRRLVTIHEQTNSNLSKLTDQLVAARAETAGLKELVASLIKDAAVLKAKAE